MKILYMSISYKLDGDGLYQNLVEELINRNHEITIVRSNPNVKRSCYYAEKKGLKVLDVKTLDPFCKNLIKKGLNQIFIASYFKSAIKKHLYDEKYDLILYATPPITLAKVIAYCKFKYGAKTYLMLKDIFPQNAVDLNMMKKSGFIYKYFRKQEKLYYRYSDFIGCMSQGNVEYVLQHNQEITSKKVGLFPNSIKIDKLDGLSFNKDKTVFMFGGNIGKPQNIPFLLDVIASLKSYKNAEFIIIGDGTEKEKILEFLESNIECNLIYKEQVPQKEFESMLKSVDVGLISLDSRFTIPNIPSKFQTYLKLKKPVFAITDVNTDLKDMILDNNCGWWCESKNIQNVTCEIKKICENKKDQKIKGENGYKLLISQFDIVDNAQKIENFVENEEEFLNEFI